MILTNKKGFVLSEAIVVAVFILGMFTFLATNILPLLSKYERVATYDNPQEVYLANTLYDVLKQERKLEVSDGIYSFEKDANNNILYKLNGVYSSIDFGDTYYKDLIYNYLQIKNIVVFYDVIADISTKPVYSRAIKEYYMYLKKRNNTSGKRVILLEFQNGMFANVIVE